MKQKTAHILLWTVLFSCIVCIAILKLTEWRPFGSATNAEGINEIMLNLSYSFMAAYIFYILNDRLPMRSRRRVAKTYVKREMRQLKELLRLCMSSLCPSLPLATELTKEEFLSKAGKKDLNDKTFSKSKTIFDQLNIYKEKITEISESLLSSYYNVMNDEQMEFVNELLNSYFVANIIVPIDYNVPDEYIDSYPNNQQEVCESIYYSYQKIRKLVIDEEN